MDDHPDPLLERLESEYEKQRTPGFDGEFTTRPSPELIAEFLGWLNSEAAKELLGYYGYNPAIVHPESLEEFWGQVPVTNQREHLMEAFCDQRIPNARRTSLSERMHLILSDDQAQQRIDAIRDKPFVSPYE